jgi:hypothetical protein
MNTLTFIPQKNTLGLPETLLVFCLLLLLWFTGPEILHYFDATAGSIDPSVWLLIVLGLIAFMMVMTLSWWLHNRFWVCLGLPHLNELVLHFKSMEPWQQLSFYVACFALLLLAATGSLMAIC